MNAPAKSTASSLAPPERNSAQALRIQPVTADTWPLMAAWAIEQGWNPGLADGECFLAQDTDGFFLGYLGDQQVSMISVVNYDDNFAFLGLYVVHPAFRHQGYGLATWRHAIAHAGDRTVGLDAVLEQVDTYKRSRFTESYRTTRYSGPIPAGRDLHGAHLVPAGLLDTSAINAYDRRIFPADRPRFLTTWLQAPAHHTLALQDSAGNIRGFGTVRPAHTGARIGPLFADTATSAEVLFDALAAHAGAGCASTLSIDIPDPNTAAHALAQGRGLKPQFQTVRMYTRRIPAAVDRVYGTTSLELG